MTSAKTIATVNAAIDLKRNAGSTKSAAELLKKVRVKPSEATRGTRASGRKGKKGLV